MNNKGRATSDSSSSLSQQASQYIYAHTPTITIQTDRPMFPSSLSCNPALSLPSASVQNQIHELAKTLPPPRKQNIACDACRCVLIYLLITIARLHRSSPRQAEESKVQSVAWTAKSTSYFFFPTVCSTDHFCLFPSAKYATPLPTLHQLYSHSDTQHCMVKNYPCTCVLASIFPSSPGRRSACLDTTPSKLPAKRSASPLSADVLARTPQTLNKGPCSPFPSSSLPHEALRFADSLLSPFSPPTPDKSFVFSFIILT